MTQAQQGKPEPEKKELTVAEKREALIEKLKKQHGKIYTLSIKGKEGYYKEPNAVQLGTYYDNMKFGEMECGMVILNNCHVGGYDFAKEESEENNGDFSILKGACDTIVKYITIKEPDIVKKDDGYHLTYDDKTGVYGGFTRKIFREFTTTDGVYRKMEFLHNVLWKSGHKFTQDDIGLWFGTGLVLSRLSNGELGILKKN